MTLMTFVAWVSFLVPVAVAALGGYFLGRTDASFRRAELRDRQVDAVLEALRQGRITGEQARSMMSQIEEAL
jgi:hypothetical protein